MKLCKMEAEKVADQINFNKMGGLIPAIAQDVSRNVLLLAFMNREALIKTLTTGKLHYYSRSRKRIWKKGESSGNEQLLKNFYIDCDKDTILFKVVQIGPTCHTGAETCFGDKEFTLENLFSIIENRKKHPKPKSYTCELLKDEKLIIKKIKEEIEELVESVKGKKSEMIWETSDLLYHLFVLLVKKGITLNEVYSELKRRRKK